ncbi:MAG TPA: YkgJ family cysteine cluster protein [Acidobacteriaceae bacterium]|jgi:Fe-S-cluster containining protein|nr:YkgJ family cysteine cluster protein [Acidobacteriaceae bacterium]
MPDDSTKMGASRQALNLSNAGAPGFASETRVQLPQANSKILQQDIQLIQIVDAALADATLRSGPHLVCYPGCTQCCHGAFAINPLDALRLRTAFTEMSIQNPAQAAAIAERARQYLAEFGPSFPGNRETGVLGITPEDEAAFEDFANEATCPALNPVTGLCEVYSARPMTCRIFGPPVRMNPKPQDTVPAPDDSEDSKGLAVCELCFTEATPEEIAASEMTVPWAEEQAILDQLGQLGRLAQMPPNAGSTIVAYCLTLPEFPSQEPS